MQREEALRKSEQMLEEDAVRFDAFLKENDEKVQEAIKRAEVEAKAKQDKVHEIKRLNAANTTIKSELNKYEEQLEECRRYKEFLDNLTPPEYFKEQQEMKAARLAEKKTRREEKKMVHTLVPLNTRLTRSHLRLVPPKRPPSFDPYGMNLDLGAVQREYICRPYV